MNIAANTNEQIPTVVTSVASPPASETTDPAEWLDSDPSVVSGFTDSGLLEYFDRPGLTTDAEHALAAEVWLRRWLYTACPLRITNAVGSARAQRRVGFSEVFWNRFMGEL